MGRRRTHRETKRMATEIAHGTTSWTLTPKLACGFRCRIHVRVDWTTKDNKVSWLYLTLHVGSWVQGLHYAPSKLRKQTDERAGGTAPGTEKGPKGKCSAPLPDGYGACKDPERKSTAPEDPSSV